MTIIQRLIATATGASLMLSAVPAFGHGLSVDVSSNASAKVGKNISVENHTHANAKVAANFGQMVKQFIQTQKDDKKDHRYGSGARLGSGVTISTEAKITAYIKARERAISSMKHVINKIADWSKRICKAQGAESTVAACVERAKVDFKAKVNVMIDAAFTL